jgi:hypothetical protein
MQEDDRDGSNQDEGEDYELTENQIV